MNTLHMNKILQQIAAQHGTTPEQVYADMECALEAGRRSTDPAVQAEWDKIPSRGEQPDLQDVILTCVFKLMLEV